MEHIEVYDRVASHAAESDLLRSVDPASSGAQRAALVTSVGIHTPDYTQLIQKRLYARY